MWRAKLKLDPHPQPLLSVRVIANVKPPLLPQLGGQLVVRIVYSTNHFKGMSQRNADCIEGMCDAIIKYYNIIILAAQTSKK